MDFLSIIEILGTFSFAVSGATMAMEKKLDPFGVLIMSFATAIGGGTLRDLMIGNLPVAWLRDAVAATVIFAGSVSAMFFHSVFRKLSRTLFLFDALGLGLFTMAGLGKGLALNFSPGICIALGTITASFGGVLRDVLLNHVPLLFRKEIYALASVAGGLLYFLLKNTGLGEETITIVCILSIVLIRVLAVQFHWSLPAFYQKKDNE